jgi:diguanylate cyclase (GGDEF)-like protein
MKNIILFFLLTLFPTYIFAQNLEKITLQLGWKYQFEFAGFITAYEKGFYKEAGFDVSIKELEKSQNVITEVLEGRSEFGVYDSDLIFAKAKGKDVVLLSNYLKRSALVLLTRPDIFSPSDLIGKKVMMLDEHYRMSSIAQMFHKFSIKEDDITWIAHDFGMNAFLEGKVDAIAAYISNEPYIAQELGVHYNVMNPEVYDMHTYNLNLFTSESYAYQNPKKVERFIEASNRGWIYAMDHKEEIAQLIKARYAPQKELKALMYEANTLESLMMRDFYDVGSIDSGFVASQAKKLAKDGLIPSAYTLNNYFFGDFTYDNALTQEKIKYLKEKKKISMCVDPDWFPYEQIVEGKHVGMSADFMHYFEKQIGIPIVLHVTKTWSESIEAIQRKECDILSLAMSTPERETYVNVTQPYMESPVVIVTSIDKPFVDNIEPLLQHDIGITKGYAYLELLQKRYPNAHFVEVNSVKDGLEKVRRGKIYGYIDTLSMAGFHIQKDYIGELKIIGKFDQGWNLGIAVRKDEPILFDIFNQIIISMDKKVAQEIYNRWIHVSFDRKMDITLLWKFLIPIVVMAFLALLYHLKIRRYLKKIEQLSIHDPLTQTYNRIKLDTVLKEQYYNYKRHGLECGVIMVDIDFFKNINDTYGHLTGDRVLQEFTQELRSHLRESDILGRWGGEEFLIIAPYTTLTQSFLLAKKLREHIEKHHFSEIKSLRASFGVSAFMEEMSIDDVITQADEALYRAKKRGRNRVEKV